MEQRTVDIFCCLRKTRERSSIGVMEPSCSLTSQDPLSFLEVKRQTPATRIDLSSFLTPLPSLFGKYVT